MTSTSSFGSSIITLQFDLDLNIDIAEQQVQASINAAGTYLPTDLPNPPIYSKVNPADSPIVTLALSSDTVPLTKVEDLADTTLSQKISQLPGVGLVTISGGQKPAVRIRVNPTALAAYGIGLEDVRTALNQTNINQAKGNFDGLRQAYTIGANDQILTSGGYRPIIIAYKNGAPVRLQDIATVEDGAENVHQAAWMNTTPAVIVNIQRQPGANIISVVDRIKALLPQLKSSLPTAVQLKILTDRTNTIRASVTDVQFELVLTVALVVMVIFLFLRNLAATVIPSIAVPLSIVGTFGVMYLLGYSLNNLTLMALTISTGFVVDDAIVMIENISRYLEEGDTPLQAALRGSEQIGFTIVSLTVSLIAVLIPLLFMGDIVGRLFREFAITLAVTILVSAFVSLTLTPMMCAKILKHKPEHEQTWFYRKSEDLFNRIIAGYGSTLQWVLKHQPLTLLVTVATLAATIVLFLIVPKGFFPVQDTGVILGVTQAPQDISFDAMSQRQQALAKNHPAGAGRREPLILYRYRWREYDAEQRPHSDQFKGRREPHAQCQRDHPAAATEAGANRRHRALYAARTRPHGGRSSQPHAIPIHARRHRLGRAQHLDQPPGRQAENAAHAARCGDGPAEQRSRNNAGDRSRHRGAAWHHDADDRRYAL